MVVVVVVLKRTQCNHLFVPILAGNKEYAMTCRVSDKADVYSYGVVLLELLLDKKALDPSFVSYGNGFNIVQWACMLLRQGRAKEFFTAGLWHAGPHDDLVEVLHLLVVCTVDSFQPDQQ